MDEDAKANLQGDLFSRGFPKFHELYYLFSIVPGKEKDFSKALRTLVSQKDEHISSLVKVLGDWEKIDAAAKKNRTIADPTKKEIVSVSNALIAFSKTGLDKASSIQVGLGGSGLGLNYLKLSDPAFDMGMGKDGPKNLNDPPQAKWDPLFRMTRIHGLLKVAGNSEKVIESKLSEIQGVLGHSIVIKDIPEQPPPTGKVSRVDGHTRPSKNHGHEHFGFRDGLSQPLLKGINSDKFNREDDYMWTDQNIITIGENPPGTQDGIKADPSKRPSWMVGGSFLAFRKLEQNVQAWNDLVAKFESAGCGSAEHCGAKLMGRWKNGAPVMDEPPKTRPRNDFDYSGVSRSACPLGAHIRKVNPRTTAESVKMTRMIRNGIPYGTESSEKPNDKRGLLFACYQSSLENGFQFVQRAWCNNETFPISRTGYDALVGQAKNEGLLHTTLHDVNEDHINPGLGQFAQMVTMRGGEYFFVPSISALRDILGSD